MADQKCEDSLVGESSSSESFCGYEQSGKCGPRVSLLERYSKAPLPYSVNATSTQATNSRTDIYTHRELDEVAFTGSWIVHSPDEARSWCRESVPGNKSHCRDLDAVRTESEFLDGGYSMCPKPISTAGSTTRSQAPAKIGHCGDSLEASISGKLQPLDQPPWTHLAADRSWYHRPMQQCNQLGAGVVGGTRSLWYETCAGNDTTSRRRPN